MHRRTWAEIATVAALAFAGPAPAREQIPNYHDYTDAEVRQAAGPRCEARWPDDLAMQVACIDNALEGAQIFRSARWGNLTNRRLQAALDRCLWRYNQNGPMDWSGIGGCTMNQMEADHQLPK